MALMLQTFRSALQAFASQQLLAPQADREREALLAEARRHAAKIGAEPLQVLHVNPDKTRCVVRCRHPRFGDCVLKTVSHQAPSGLRVAHVESLRLAHASDPGLFPALLELGHAYSLEELIDGPTLHRIPQADWANVDLVGFFARLRGFGVAEVTGEPIGGDECVRTTFRFVRMILRASRYAVGNMRPWHVSAFAFPQQARAALDLLLNEAAAATLPRSLVFSDLAPANVMQRKATGEIAVVDLEHMQEGFFGFDALWLLAMLTRSQCPAEIIEDAYDRVCRDEFTGAEASRLMRAMFAFLLDVLGGYVGRWHGQQAIRSLRQRVQADLRGEPSPRHRDTDAAVVSPGPRDPARASAT